MERINISVDKRILKVRDLKVVFHTDDGIIRAVNGITFSLEKGETLGIVGESGSGKTVTALSILRILPQPQGKITSGEINFRGIDLLTLKESEMRKIRGRRISMVFQEPASALNPVLTIGEQISETVRAHFKVSRGESMERAIQVLKEVGFPSPEKGIHSYPHQLSGGMKQRAMIAIALSCSPEILIADEPTTALDVTIQAQIMELLRRLREKMGMSMILITHDLGLVAENCHRVIIMYAGRIMEMAPVSLIFSNPLHPYTKGLLQCMPSIDEGRTIKPISGMVPDPRRPIPGCPFHDRCPDFIDICSQREPDLVEVEKDHFVACLNI